MSSQRTQEFINATTSIAQDPSYQQWYNFYKVEVSGDQMSKSFTSQEDAQNDSDFMKLCQAFCIVNPSQNRIYSIEDIGGSKTYMVKSLFNKFKDW